MTYESQGKPLLTIADAIEAGSYFENSGAHVIRVGDAKGKFEKHFVKYLNCLLDTKCMYNL